VIENVVGAPLLEPTLICGTMFDPPMAVQRHRLFEANWDLTPPAWPCRHDLWEPQFPPTRSDRTRLAGTVSVFGAGGGRAKNYALWKWAMDVDWMTKHELAQAIPPAYCEFIGAQLMQHVRARSAA
jgi:DNA (cytosine-5)-methyltransferase 1